MAASGPLSVAVAPLTTSGYNRTADGLQTRFVARPTAVIASALGPARRAIGIAPARSRGPLAAARSLGEESGHLTFMSGAGLNRQRRRPPPRPALRIARASPARRRLPCLARKACISRAIAFASGAASEPTT